MKIYDFIIVFKRPGYRWVDYVSQLMLLLSVSVFTFSLSVAVFNIASVLIMVLIAAIIAWWIYTYKRQKKGHLPFYRLALFFAAIGWTLQPGGKWIAAVYLLAAALEKQVKFPQEVAFDEVEIVFNTLPKKIYSWADLSNVVLKDGILTVDFKNNKLIQKEIESQTSAKEEQEFNEFCVTMLNAEC